MKSKLEYIVFLPSITGLLQSSLTTADYIYLILSIVSESLFRLQWLL